MEDPKHSTYIVKSFDQLKVLSNNFRVRILNLYDDWEPRTNKQIADALQLPPSKVHYHVRELERVGLLQLVETRQSGGVVEKFYLPIAMSISIEWDDVQETAETKGLKKRVKDAAMDDFWASYRQAHDEAMERLYRPASELEAMPPEQRKRFMESIGFAHLTDEEYTELRSEMVALLKRWQERGTMRTGTKSYRLFWTMFEDVTNGK
ncbi:transcriptional regulator [Tumebacillus flagellatus]|uniref:ArsR family transcriptional regulator n=1 Tax=Tumebacillus flagellatus TaxID=1157490 RepID=A0A074LMS4_9BACL|nr:transcriptional regulator [Tumebacillus flagellatus]KEO82434.1 hypothetical protein EL26_15250 [Tumebacillus flagellatus]